MYHAFSKKKLSRSIINEKALLFGIDAASETFLHALRSQREPLYDILGIVEKEKHHTHRYIHGIPVLGSIGQLDGIVQGLQKKGKAVDVLLAAPTHLSFQIIALLTQKARTLKISLRQISAASKENTKIQNLNFSTFLKHSRCEADISNILKTFKSKKILITGAGSCLGKECALQLANVLPSHITLLDHKANALYDTAQEVHQTHPRLSHKALLCDVRQKKTVFDIIEQEKPDFIFHLAALRQAALVENQPAEGTFTQTLGTKYLADAAKANNVKAMLFVSTCRMQEPRNILDLTQYGGEVYCQFLDRSGGENSTKFLSVRVGAVLGGKNSITTRLQKQIDARKTITLLHPDVSRHFIPLQEAAQLIIHSMFIKLNTLLPHGSTFTLDRGEKISLLEMAKTLIELSGLVPYEDIPITFMGLNANSSLKDMPIPPQEKIRRTVHPYIYALEPPTTFPSFFIKNMDKLEKAACENNHDLCTQMLKRLSIAEPLSTTPTREVLF